MNCSPSRVTPPSFVSGLVFVLFVVTQCHGQNQEVPSPTSQVPILDTVIESWPVDAAMTRSQERAIWEKLCQPYIPNAKQIPLDRWVNSVSPICPMDINEYALERIGLSSDVEIAFRMYAPPEPLLVHAILAIEQIECALEIRHGVVRITTQDDADANLSIRIYDVSSLTGGGDAREKLVAAKYLMDTIQWVIQPDGWEILGGTSTIKLFPMKDKQLLCVATRTQTHLQLQAFLDQLQRAGGEPMTPQQTVPSRTQLPQLKFQPKPKPKPLDPQPRFETELPRFRPQ